MGNRKVHFHGDLFNLVRGRGVSRFIRTHQPTPLQLRVHRGHHTSHHLLSHHHVLGRQKRSRQIARLYLLECQRFTIWGKSAKAVVMVIAAFLLCWVPIDITPAFILPSSPPFLCSLKIALAFTYLSSAINPFIFCWRLADFRKALCSRLHQANAVIHPN